MQDLNDFFKNQANECRNLAERSKSKDDRNYWLGLAERWEWMQKGGAPVETVKLRFERRIFAKSHRRAAA